jgi:cell division septation protein DedD
MAKKTKKTKKATKKTYRFEMTSLSLGFWAFCLFFLLSWIFVLGIFVGRGFLPGGKPLLSELKGQMDKLQTAVMPRKPSNAAPEVKEEEENPKLAFYESLSSKKKEVRMGVEPPKPNPVKKNQAEAHRKEAGNNPQGLDPGDRHQYTVQLASLGERARADALIKGLRDQGYEAYVAEAVVGGKVYYRVRCGRFLTREEAGQHVRKLAKEAGLKGFVARTE